MAEKKNRFLSWFLIIAFTIMILGAFFFLSEVIIRECDGRIVFLNKEIPCPER